MLNITVAKLLGPKPATFYLHQLLNSIVNQIHSNALSMIYLIQYIFKMSIFSQLNVTLFYIISTFIQNNIILKQLKHLKAFKWFLLINLKRISVTYKIKNLFAGAICAYNLTNYCLNRLFCQRY